MAVEVAGGTFNDELYQVQRGDGAVGARMALTLKPNPAFLREIPDATHGPIVIDLVQIARELRESDAGPDDGVQRKVGNRERQVPIGPHRGWGVDVDWQAAWDSGYQKIAAARRSYLEEHIAQLDEAIASGDSSGKARVEMLRWQLAVDRLKGDDGAGRKAAGKALTSLDPRYGQQRVGAEIPVHTTQAAQQAGNAVVLEQPYRGSQRVGLRDAPSVPVTSGVLGMDFEVAVLLEYGPQEARRTRFAGSVRWGWRRPPRGGDVALAPLGLVSRTGISEAFRTAAAHWNTLTVEDPAELVHGPQRVMPLPL
jgi:hypothetical protein